MKKIVPSSIMIALLILSFPGMTTFPVSMSELQDLSIEASNDDKVEVEFLLHNSRDVDFRTPGWGDQKTGAVPIGTDVKLRIMAAKDDLTQARLRLWNGVSQQESFLQMNINQELSNTTHDMWEATVASPNTPTDYYYSFHLIDGTDEAWYNDDTVITVVDRNIVYHTGGVGRATSSHFGTGDYALVFYDPDFRTPDWHKASVGYQIFIDRFYNGDQSNDPIGDGQSGDILFYEWDSNGNGIADSEDEGRRYAEMVDDFTTPAAQGGFFQFYGGDMQGVIDKVDYLTDLGIDFIWFNPFTEAIEYHGYTVNDYYVLDANYGRLLDREAGRVYNNVTGSMEIFDALDTTLEAHDIKIIYDVVINHASAQGMYFQRFENPDVYGGDSGYNITDHFPEVVGAFENPFISPYKDMFTFYDFNHNYNAWAGFNHIPTINYQDSSPALELLVTGENNLFDYWMDRGVDGFRLDVSNEYDDGQNSNLVNQAIRNTVKASNENAVIIGEIWERASQWLAGNMNDGTQNMPFRFNTLDWMMSNYNDELYTNLLYTQQENYPKEAFHSLWVNLGNHDTSRALSLLEGSYGKLEVAATLMFGFPGVPVIYYGDETGMKGFGDPQNRSPYPWHNQNLTLINHYKSLIHTRKSYPVLQTGDFSILEDNAEGVITYHRYLPGDTFENALVIGNRDSIPKEIRIDMSSTNLIDGNVLVDLLDNNQTYGVLNSELSFTLPGFGKMVLMSGIAGDMSLESEKDDDKSQRKASVGTFSVLLAIIPITTTARFKKGRKMNS